MPPSTRAPGPDERQLILPLSPLRNRDFLSNHWLEHRLPLEPEWKEHIEAAKDVLKGLMDLWRVQRARVALYGDEAGLEEKFIQPVFELLGWHLEVSSLPESTRARLCTVLERRRFARGAKCRSY